jgi:hypothetical protein
MITIHYRTPNSLELSISAGKYVRLFSAFKRERRWVIEEHRGHEVEILGIATLVAMFLFFSMIEENLLTFQECEFKE